MKRSLVLELVLVLSFASAWGGDDRLHGSWKTAIYTIAGVDHPMDGIMIFTPSYFSANVMLNFGGGGQDDSNANAGPYFAENGKITFYQWMQLHVRPGKPNESFLHKGIDEAAGYRFESPDRLIISFPSGNFYVLERLPDARSLQGVEGLWSYTTLQPKGRDPVELTGLFLLHQGIFIQQTINDGEPFERQLGQGHSGTYTERDGKLALHAQVGLVVDPTRAEPLESRSDTDHEIVAQRRGTSLTFTFGSGTVQTFERVPQKGPTEVFLLEQGVLALVDRHFLLVAETGGRALSGSGRFQREGSSLKLEARRWFSVDGRRFRYLKDKTLEAKFDGVTLTLPGGTVFRVRGQSTHSTR